MKERRSDVLSLCLAVVLMASLWQSMSKEEAASWPTFRMPAKATPSESSAPQTAPAEAPPRRLRMPEAERPAIAPTAPVEEGHSQLADKLNAPENTGYEDLGIVMHLFGEYRKRFDGYPVGEENAAFVNALAGNNPARMAFIDRSNPAIDAEGRLCDRWGSPLFFHLISRDDLEIRSAGPDREMYTEDDQIRVSPALNAERLASSR